MLKKGTKLRCKKGGRFLTVGKVYVVEMITKTGENYLLRADDGMIDAYRVENFDKMFDLVSAVKKRNLPAWF